MKIAFIGQKGIPAQFGGVEKHTEELAIRLAKKGHQVFVYVRNNYTDKKTIYYQGVKLIHLPSIHSKNLDAISHTFLATFHALFQNYDVIHYHAIGPSSLSFVIKIFKRKTALIVTHHCQDYYHKKWSFLAKTYLRFGEYVAITWADKIITVSKVLESYIKNKFQKKAVVIPNGVDVSISDNKNYLKKWNLQKNSYILFVGRLIRHKGAHYLIKAFKVLEDKHLTREKKLVIVGDGFYTDDYIRELKDLARGRENIIFTGNQTKEALAQLFSHCYLFVHPSQSEGLSLALLEAMGYGKAVIASDIKENLEVINDNTGKHFQSGNSEDLEKNIVYLINNPLVVKQLGEKAMLEAQKRYSWDNIVNKTEKLYQEVLEKKVI